MRTFLLVSLLGAFVCTTITAPLPAQTLQDHFYYVSPRPGAKLLPTATTIIFRPVASELGTPWMSNVRVVGSASGGHSGDWIQSDDSKTFIFKPHQPFEPGETVSVSYGATEPVAPGRKDPQSLTSSPQSGSFSFKITPGTLQPDAMIDDFWPDEYVPRPGPKTDRKIARTSTTTSLPYELPEDFPPITVLENNDPEDGYVFVTNIGFGAAANPYGSYVMILRDDGFPIFFRKVAERGLDFKKQPNGLLTYFQAGRFDVMDDTYTVIDSWYAGNGYTLDRHDLQMLDNGHVLLVIYDRQPVDMSQVVAGGDPNATVVGLVVQELDAAKNVVFQWRSWDYIPITDANQDLLASNIDYIHGNAIELDHDGNILISGRNTEEITKINRETGDVMWRMGGKANEFTLVGDTQWFSRQHDIRRLPNGHITLWNNGNLNDPQRSRPVEYAVDEENKIVTLVWEYLEPSLRYASAMGNHQRLPGGNTFMGWGFTNPNATEVRPDGTKAWEMTFPEGTLTYRAFKFDWSGVAAEPYAWTRTTDDRLMLYFDKFGDKTVDRYIVYRGEMPEPTSAVAWTDGHSAAVRNFVAGETLYLRVRSVDCDGNMGPFSNEIALTPDFSDTPEMITADVSFQPKALNRGAHGRWVEARIELPSPYLAQDVDLGSVLLNGEVLAASDWKADKHGAHLTNGNPPLDATGGRGNDRGHHPDGDDDDDHWDHHGNDHHGDRKKRDDDDDGDRGHHDGCHEDQGKVSVKFSRQAVADILPTGDAVEVTITGYVGDVYFEGTDIIKVFGGGDASPVSAQFRSGERAIASVLDNYPNPFNPVTTIRFDLRNESVVRLTVYSVDGRRVRTLASGPLSEGSHFIEWDGRDASGNQVSSGVYLYRLEAGVQVLTRKMVLLK